MAGRNEYFPDRVANDATPPFFGWGARVLATEHLSAFAAMRVMIQSRRGVPDAGMFLPVRGGLAWRF